MDRWVVNQERRETTRKLVLRIVVSRPGTRPSRSEAVEPEIHGMITQTKPPDPAGIPTSLGEPWDPPRLVGRQKPPRDFKDTHRPRCPTIR